MNCFPKKRLCVASQPLNRELFCWVRETDCSLFFWLSEDIVLPDIMETIVIEVRGMTEHRRWQCECATSVPLRRGFYHLVLICCMRAPAEPLLLKLSVYIKELGIF